MARTKRGVISRAKHNKVLKSVKVKEVEEKILYVSLVKQWKKRCNMPIETGKLKKREFRSLWIQRINAGVRAEGLTYAKFINGLAKSKSS